MLALSFRFKRLGILNVHNVRINPLMNKSVLFLQLLVDHIPIELYRNEYLGCKSYIHF